MGLKNLDDNQRESILRASDLIRAAGWEKKAQTIQDFLGSRNQIFIDPDMDPEDAAQTQANKKPQIITISPKLPLTAGDPARPLQKSDPDFVVLAGVLLHEADHAHFHGEIEAYGEEVEFFQAVNEDFNKYFPGLPQVDADAVKEKKHMWERGCKAHRESFINSAKVTDFKSAKHARFAPRPAPKYGAMDKAMLRWARLIFRFARVAGGPPRGGNLQLVGALREWDPSSVKRGDLNGKGELTDPNGRPYLYRSPGWFYPELFDLISTPNPEFGNKLGPDDHLCLLYRR